MADGNLAAQVILMVGVALDELAMVEAEPDLAKTRMAIASVRSTLRELLKAAQAEQQDRTPPTAPIIT
jgi:hypothetical protein